MREDGKGREREGEGKGYLRDEAICDRVGEWYKEESNEGGKSVTDEGPIDARYLSHHHAADLRH